MPDDRNLPRFNHSPLLWLAISFAAGILAGHYVDVSSMPWLVICCLLSVAGYILQKTGFATLLILLTFLFAGAATIRIEKASLRSDRLKVLIDGGTFSSGTPVEIEGVVRRAPEPNIDGQLIELASERLRYHGDLKTISGNVRIILPQPANEKGSPVLRYGSRIRAVCRLTREEAYLNPGVMSRKAILDRQDIDAACSVKSPLLIEHIADESVFAPLAWVYDQRARLISDFRNNLDTKTAGIMIASLLGDKYFLDKDTGEVFRDGGTFHVLVISGLHITFIGGLLLLFVRQITRNRWLQLVATSTVLWAYTLAVGADVPVVRAAIMFTIVLLSYAIYRQGNLLNSLGLCSLLLLVWRPYDLFDASFQLTIVSVGSIVGMAFPLIDQLRLIGEWTPSPASPFPPNVGARLRQFCEFLYWNPASWTLESAQNIWSANLFKPEQISRYLGGGLHRVVRLVVEGVIVSLIVQLWMLPLLVVYFHRISVASVVLNLWVGFFIAIESFSAVAGVFALRISSLLAVPFFELTEIVNWVMLSLPQLFADNGVASFRLPAYSGYGASVYGVYFVPIIALVFVLHRWEPFSLSRITDRGKHVLRITCVSLLTLILITVLHPFSAPRPDGRLHIDFLDVGQGDAALITFPDGRTLLVDGGGRFQFKAENGGDEDGTFEPDVRGVGESVVSEVLWYKGYSQIDHVLATHADADHMQGLTDVARNFRIGSVLVGRSPIDDSDFSELIQILRRRSMPLETISRGDILIFGDVRVEVLYPIATTDPEAVSDNDHSVVIRVVFGNRSFLLTGDIERNAEKELVEGGGVLASDVVKVAHHGSRTSSTAGFVDAVTPGIAVIPVGRTSPFGHPHADVVDRWRASGATVMTTGERGMISISTDGKDLRTSTFVPY